ncbi:MAG: hypothetical protein JXB04_09200 [Kiritimatiellae bacterium]|nr:hypothetical protein [Kiritimatiellia bacterium]
MQTNQVITAVLLIFPGLMVVWGIYECVTAIRTSHRVLGVLAIILGLGIYIGSMVVIDYRIARKTEEDIQQCFAHLEEVGKAIQEFKAKKGRLPRNLMELYNAMQIPLCPVHRGQANAGYNYRLPPGSGEHQIICWDARPHVYHYRFLKPLQKSYRNVLFLDGTVMTLEESEIPIMSVGGVK